MNQRRLLLMIFTEVNASGGIQRFNRNLIAAGGCLGYEQDVYSLMDPVRELPSIDSAAPVRGFGGNRLRFAIAVFRALLFSRCDAVFIGHVNFVVLAAAALRLRSHSRPRSLLVAHGIDAWSGIQGARRRALSHVDHILCVSNYTRRSIQRQAPELARERFSIFPNALDASWAATADRAFDADSPVVPEWRFILAVGRIDREDRTKGIITTLEALAAMADRTLGIVIAGRGGDLPVLRGIAERLGLADRVRFAGAVSDRQLFALYRQCEAFVLPSGQEGFGIVFLEAMFFGAPVIAARAKGAVDVVQDDVTGLLVDYGDVVALRHAMTRLLGDSGLRERLRCAGRAQVMNSGPFTFAAFVDRWRTVTEPTVAPAPAERAVLP